MIMKVNKASFKCNDWEPECYCYACIMNVECWGSMRIISTTRQQCYNTHFQSLKVAAYECPIIRRDLNNLDWYLVIFVSGIGRIWDTIQLTTEKIKSTATPWKIENIHVILIKNACSFLVIIFRRKIWKFPYYNIVIKALDIQSLMPSYMREV